MLIRLGQTDCPICGNALRYCRAVLPSLYRRRRNAIVIGQDTSARAPRAAALLFAAFAVGATVLGFIDGLMRPSQDFASMYAAARAVADSRTANVYDFATLAQLNTTHHYVSEPLLPFTYP